MHVGLDSAGESLVPLDLREPAMMVAAAQNKLQRKRFLSNAATFCTMQVRCMKHTTQRQHNDQWKGCVIRVCRDF